MVFSLFRLFQHAEITRTYIRAPPNKTALEINLPVQKLNLPIAMSTSGANTVTSSINNKSRHNPIAKFFTRISSVPTGTHTSKGSPQYQNNNSSSSSSNTDNNSQSTSSSPSSLSSSSLCVTSSPSSTSLSLLQAEDSR